MNKPRSIPEDLYMTPTDFGELSEAYPALKQYLFKTLAGWSLNFKDDHAQRDFGLRIDLPKERLCPAVPNRLNYVRWIQKIVANRSFDEQSLSVLGLDVGTGASAIYPLLACTVEPSWLMIATDIDDLSLGYATTNVTANGLDTRIKIVKSTASSDILKPVADSTLSCFEFTMCNPPFYSSHEDVIRSAEMKDFAPNAVCTGADVEMITPGGESGFVLKMIDESLFLQDRCRWFTSMLGKLSSLSSMVDALRKKNIDNFAVSELVQGQTRRWVIAWSFFDERLPDNIARPSFTSVHGLTPLPNTLRQPFDTAVLQITTSKDLFNRVLSVLDSLDGVSYKITEAAQIISANAPLNTWSRSARRQKPKHRAAEIPDTPVPRMICDFSIAHGENGVFILMGSWRHGRSRAGFESFWSHVTRKVAYSFTVISASRNMNQNEIKQA